MKPGFHPLIAAASFVQLSFNPNHAPTGARLLGSLSGRTYERMFDRFVAQGGLAILNDPVSLASRLSDTDALEALPADTLGAIYLRWGRRRGYSPPQLMDLVRESVPMSEKRHSPDELAFYEREIAAHDLWHVVAGYGAEPLGEVCEVHFMSGVYKNPGFRVICPLTRAFHWKNRVALDEAYRRGRAAAWLPATRWENLLDRPLTEVRHSLGLGAKPLHYSTREFDWK